MKIPHQELHSMNTRLATWGAKDPMAILHNKYMCFPLFLLACPHSGVNVNPCISAGESSECHISRIICDWPSTSPVYAASVLFIE